MNPTTMDAHLETAFRCTLQASLAASVLACLVALLILVFQKRLPPRWRYALWLLVVVRLLVPMTPSSSLSLFNLKNHSSLVKAEARLRHSLAAPPSAPASQSPPLVASAMASSPAPAPVASADPMRMKSHSTLRTAARYLWPTGAACYLLLVLVQHRKLSNWVKRQPERGTARLTALVREAQGMLGLPGDIAVLRADCQGSPAVFRLRRPCLLLPGATIDSLEDHELRLVILHELVHVQRRDVLLNWAAIVAQSLHWFNPLVWLVLKRWRADRELVCDAEVMARLTPLERHAYGSTLLKLATTFSEPLWARSVTPILEHQHEIERRITMISNYKPMPRATAAALVASLVVLGALTFTRAAEQTPAPKPVQQPEKVASSDKQEKAGKPGIPYMERELAKLKEVLKKKQVDLYDMRVSLRMTGAEAAGADLLEPETLRKLETSRIEAAARCKQLETMGGRLKDMPRSQLKQAILVTYPDAQLAGLLSNENSAEQKLAELRATYSSGHPEVQRVSNLLQTVNRQTDERLMGLLQGLKAKLDSEQAAAAALEESIAQTKERDIRRAVERQPYFEAKRELENLTLLRDRLQLQLFAEKINAGLPLSP
jgi:beta-lactamase regulating signal transducer with metallopeptidase domain